MLIDEMRQAQNKLPFEWRLLCETMDGSDALKASPPSVSSLPFSFAFNQQTLISRHGLDSIWYLQVHSRYAFTAAIHTSLHRLITFWQQLFFLRLACLLKRVRCQRRAYVSETNHSFQVATAIFWSIFYWRVLDGFLELSTLSISFSSTSSNDKRRWRRRALCSTRLSSCYHHHFRHSILLCAVRRFLFSLFSWRRIQLTLLSHFSSLALLSLSISSNSRSSFSSLWLFAV